jgi:hypothetical protein
MYYTMAADQVKPKLKPVDPKAREYHHFEYDVAHFGLFDDADDGTPVVVGSRNLVDATIRRLPQSVTIYYYKKDNKGFWIKKAIYEGKAQKNLQAVVQPKEEAA